jgi:hypothetical protein
LTKRDDLWDLTLERICDVGIISIRELLRYMIYKKTKKGEISRQEVEEVVDTSLIFAIEEGNDIPYHMFDIQVAEVLQDVGYQIEDMKEEIDFAIKKIDEIPSKNTTRRTMNIIEEKGWIAEYRNVAMEKKWVPGDKAIEYMELKRDAELEALLNRMPAHYSIKQIYEVFMEEPERAKAITGITDDETYRTFQQYLASQTGGVNPLREDREGEDEEIEGENDGGTEEK